MKLLYGMLLSLMLVTGCQHKIIQSGNSLPAYYGFFLFSFALNRCPSDHYFPLQRKVVADALFEAGNFDGPYCHGFTKYTLSSKKGLSYVDTAPIYMRLQTGAPCSVFVAVPTERMCTGQTLDQCAAYQTAAKQVTLFLKMHYADGEADLTPQPSTMNVNGFSEHKDFEQWCSMRIRKKTDATAHPIFH